MTLTELMLKMLFVKHWRAWKYYDWETGELRFYTIECLIEKTKYTPQMAYRTQIRPEETVSLLWSEGLVGLKPVVREMTARLDKALEDYVANL